MDLKEKLEEFITLEHYEFKATLPFEARIKILSSNKNRFSWSIDIGNKRIRGGDAESMQEAKTVSVEALMEYVEEETKKLKEVLIDKD